MSTHYPMRSTIGPWMRMIDTASFGSGTEANFLAAPCPFEFFFGYAVFS